MALAFGAAATLTFLASLTTVSPQQVFDQLFSPADTVEAGQTEAMTAKEYQLEISPYDSLLQAYADTLGWDWKILAAMVYHESRFLPNQISPAGAVGLMQVMPGTARRLGTFNLKDPADNIRAGVACLLYLQAQWSHIPDAWERKKFILASYNVGPAHVQDAVRLARKHGKSTTIWDGHVGDMLKKKQDPAFYQDEVVKHGRCRGNIPVGYVKKVLAQFDLYAQMEGVLASAQ